MAPNPSLPLSVGALHTMGWQTTPPQLCITCEHVIFGTFLTSLLPTLSMPGMSLHMFKRFCWTLAEQWFSVNRSVQKMQVLTPFLLKSRPKPPGVLLWHYRRWVGSPGTCVTDLANASSNKLLRGFNKSCLAWRELQLSGFLSINFTAITCFVLGKEDRSNLINGLTRSPDRTFHCLICPLSVDAVGSRIYWNNSGRNGSTMFRLLLHGPDLKCWFSTLLASGSRGQPRGLTLWRHGFRRSSKDLQRGMGASCWGCLQLVATVQCLLLMAAVWRWVNLPGFLGVSAIADSLSGQGKGKWW